MPEADYQIGDTRYVAFAHDWRRIGVAEWLERTAARELGDQVSVQPSEPAAALSQEEFAASVKNACARYTGPNSCCATLCSPPA